MLSIGFFFSIYIALFFVWDFIFSAHRTKKKRVLYLIKNAWFEMSTINWVAVCHELFYIWFWVSFFVYSNSVYKMLPFSVLYLTLRSLPFSASIAVCVCYTQQLGSAIKCFECNSHYNQGCEQDLVPSNFSVDCSLKQDRDDRNKPIQYTLCRKVLQVIEFSVNQCK